ncbi:MAG: nicotinamide riboside transporter PnuC [Prolixibacteraceae bacterium]|jgi:nicotinamide mononucleotide transporter|nr:nicotinamide riboside transporter PnuC [Prolixibacteraceae bacterium]
MNQIIGWLSENYIEVLGAILGFLYIIFSIRQNILTWLTGLVTSALYIYVFFVAKFYADMALQVYYVVISIYGWYHWVKGASDGVKTNLPVTRLKLKTGLVLAISSVILYVFIFFILKNYTDSPVPHGDALTTALSIVATWMLARKIIEHWLIWIFVDALSMGLYIYKSLWPTAILFFVYTVMAYIGYIQWKKEIQQD